MNPLPQQIFDLLHKLTSPLNGYRTLLGTVGAIALLAYAVVEGNYVLAGLAMSQVMAALGLHQPAGDPQPSPGEVLPFAKP